MKKVSIEMVKGNLRVAFYYLNKHKTYSLFLVSFTPEAMAELRFGAI
jgi:hypothetical protein